MKFLFAFRTLSWKKPLWLRILYQLWLFTGSVAVFVFVGTAGLSVLTASAEPLHNSYQFAIGTCGFALFASPPCDALLELLFLIPLPIPVPEFLLKLVRITGSSLSLASFIAFIPLLIFRTFFQDYGLNPVIFVASFGGAFFLLQLIFPYALRYGTVNFEPLRAQPNYSDAIVQIKNAAEKNCPFTAIRIAFHAFGLDLRRAEALAHEICYADEIPA